MVQLQNSPTPLQARPARPKWPPPSLHAVARSRRSPRGTQACPARPPGGAAPAARPALSGWRRGRNRVRGGGRSGAAAPGAGATGCSRVAPVRSASGAGFAQTTSRTPADGGAGRDAETLTRAGAEGVGQGSSGRRWKPSAAGGGGGGEGDVRSTGKERVTTNRCSDAGVQRGGRHRRAANASASTGLDTWRGRRASDVRILSTSFPKLY